MASALGEQTKVISKTLTLGVGESEQIDGTVSLLVITSKGIAFTGSAIFNVGYGRTQEEIQTVSNSTSGVGVSSGGSVLGITKSQWGNVVITNNYSANVTFHLFYIAPSTN